MTARSQSDIFQAWKSTNPEVLWRTYQTENRLNLIGCYQLYGFRVIPLAIKGKAPKAGFDWVDSVMSKIELFNHLEAGGNIGVVAGLCKPKLVILDYDGEELPEELKDKTLTSISPNGFHLFFKGAYNDRRFQRLKKKFPKMDVARAGNGYVVVPPSITCKFEHSKHLCGTTDHEYRVHEWVDINKPIIPFNSI